MICPKCSSGNDHVINSDESTDGREQIRRRQCGHCQHRWFTRELHESRLQSPRPSTRRRVIGPYHPATSTPQRV